MKKPDEGSKTTVPGFDLNDLSATGQRSFAAMTHVNAHFFQALARYNGALLDFARRRLDRDLQMSEKLAGCKTPNEAADLVQDFYKTAYTDYSDELGELMDLGAKITTSTMDGIGREAAAVIDTKSKSQTQAAS